MIARVALKPRSQRQSVITILDALDDPHLFQQHFKNVESWSAWRAFLAALFGLPLTTDQQQLFKQCTKREHPSDGQSNEAFLVIGRRGGKSFILATIAAYLATLKDWRPYLGPGERATVMVIAADRKQARVIMRYVKGLLLSVPMLSRLIQAQTQDRIDLDNRVTIEVHTTSFRSTRGYTIVAALCDEIAFWPTDENAAEPDYEILTAIRPGMATVPGAMLLCASSPYARRGALWDAWRRHYGKEHDPILVWQAPTRTMNPTVRQAIIDEAIQANPSSAQAEYGAVFRSDVEQFVSREIVQACVSTGVYERPPLSSTSYKAFLDFAGGSGGDSMSLCIGHKHGTVVVVDALREVKPPFSPEFAIAQFVHLLKGYRIYTVEGDAFGGEFAREPFRKHGINYQIAKKSKSDLYLHHLLPMLNSGRVDLIDHPRAIGQIVGLECHTARAGRDKIDHAPGGHDDLANCIAGCVARASGGGYQGFGGDWVSGPDKPPEEPKAQAERVNALIERLKRGEPIPF
jgi:hypothetical protein